MNQIAPEWAALIATLLITSVTIWGIIFSIVKFIKTERRFRWLWALSLLVVLLLGVPKSIWAWWKMITYYWV